MRNFLPLVLVLTICFSCKKDHSAEPGENPTVNTPGSSSVQWSASDQTVTSGQEIQLGFNNTIVALRDAQQKLHLVWQDNLVIKYGRLTNGSWNIISMPKISTAGTVSKATIGMDNSGSLYLSWTESEGLNSRSILISRSVDGGITWTSPYAVKTGNLESSLSMFVFNRPSTTGITLCWHDLTAQKNYVSTWNGNNWSATDWTLSQGVNTGNSVSHDATVSGYGSILYLAWEDDRSGQNEIYLKKSTDGGISWGTEFPLSATAGSIKGQDPSIALASDGRLHIAWQNLSKIYYSSSSNAGQSAFSTPVMIGDGLFAHMALNTKNMMAISWEHFTGNMTNDSGKSFGLLLSYDSMQNYTAPNVLPGSSSTFYSLQCAVTMSSAFIDVFWIDKSDSSNKKLKYRYAEIL